MRFSRVIAGFVVLFGISQSQAVEPPDFARDVRPILARHCFKCHGQDPKARKAKLRLDLRDSAVAESKSGVKPIVPAKPEQSEIIRRVTSADESEVMPPPETKDSLTEAEKQTLKQWIAAGAEYKPHWAFLAPKQSPIPKVKKTDWPRNPIDNFILARLEKEGLQPSPTADRHVLVRRAYLDLIGLPPTPEEADAFINDKSPNAYEKLIDRLLASPHYGERWGRRWLDLARYADTNGYEKDRQRSIWPYRDWVIAAINADKPFDQFTIEQIAGDMLPNATLDQRIATGFHRNTMLNEEGGIDPLEYRFHAMTDRVLTTGTTWLGLTIGCAQCHTHKYDPIPHKEYYQFMAFLNNADEPELDVAQPEIARQRADIEKKIADVVADLPNRFPVETIRWHTPAVVNALSANGAKPEILADGSVRFGGEHPDQDSYTLFLDANQEVIDFIRLEALADPALPMGGPGRSSLGNFVLSEFIVTAAPKGAADQMQPVKLTKAEADFSQKDFPVANLVDGNWKAGWAIGSERNWNVNRTATLTPAAPIRLPGGARLMVRLDQQHGDKHTLGRFRIGVGQQIHDSRPEAVRRQEHLDRKFNEWLDRESARTVRWTVLRPVEAKSNLPLLTVLDDNSIFSSGDQTKRDVYDLKFRSDLRGITAIRLETIPDERLPKHGPGRIWYEGPFGDFQLSEFTVTAAGQPVKLSDASQSFGNGSQAKNAIDGSPQTNWSINGGQGRPHHAVFNLEKPLDNVADLGIQFLFEFYFPTGIGRSRISITTDSSKAVARNIPVELEELLLIPKSALAAEQRQRLLQHFLLTAPELSKSQGEIEKLRKGMPEYPTTLVMLERPPTNVRKTTIHNRGEFLQPTDAVEAGWLSFLPGMPKEAPRNRLTFARWLVSPKNPLVGRVTMNRQWAAFFGRGLVRTVEDFGFQGELPSHPELLDWLAIEFVTPPSSKGGAGGVGWSMKKMHKMIVTSATYQQSSQVTPELLAKDAENKLLARGPRGRLEAEIIRDSALRISGLLSTKIGGPSVFPPQPPGVTTEGAYGPLEWKASKGEDRYRRGLYTFAKRTQPYAMFATFDGPSGEACIAQREVSNTPLQALTVLNDNVFIEAAQALGRMLAVRQGTAEQRIEYLYRRCFTRPLSSDDKTMLLKFYETQKQRFEKKELDAVKIAGEGAGDVNDRAAWTVLARTLLNLDEAITKN